MITLGKQKELYECDYDELDKIASEHYGFDYKCQQMEEWSNDTEHTVCGDKDCPLDEYEEKDLKYFIDSEGNSYCSVYTIVQDLVNNEVIQPAEYLIKVW